MAIAATLRGGGGGGGESIIINRVLSGYSNRANDFKPPYGWKRQSLQTMDDFPRHTSSPFHYHLWLRSSWSVRSNRTAWHRKAWVTVKWSDSWGSAPASPTNGGRLARVTGEITQRQKGRVIGFCATVSQGGRQHSAEPRASKSCGPRGLSSRFSHDQQQGHQSSRPVSRRWSCVFRLSFVCDGADKGAVAWSHRLRTILIDRLSGRMTELWNGAESMGIFSNVGTFCRCSSASARALPPAHPNHILRTLAVHLTIIAS